MNGVSAMRRPLIAGVVTLALLATAACGDDDESTGGTGSEKEGARIALLAAAIGNAFVDASVKAMEAGTKAEGVELMVFDAQFDPQKQLSQCQDAVAQGVDAIVAMPAAGTPLIPCAAEAGAADIPFLVINQPLGTSVETGEPTAEGVSAQIMTPLAKIAEGQIAQVVAACGGIDPCDVVYLGAAQLLPQTETAFQNELGKAESENPNIKVTTAEAGADRAGGLKAMQDTLQRISKPSVVTSPNTEPMEGATQALTEAKLTLGKDVKIVANGASVAQIARVKSGEYLSTYVQLPASETLVALDFTLRLIAGESMPTWADAHEEKNIPFFITAENVDEVSGFAGEW